MSLWNFATNCLVLEGTRQHIKKQSITLPKKGLSSQSYGFSSGCVWMWELDHKEGWAQKNWCFSTVVLEKTLESSLDCKEIKPVNPKGNQSWIFIGRTNAEAETPILWPPDVTGLEKTLMLGKIEGRRRGDDRRWDGWIASPTRWTWVWASSGSLWWTGKTDMLHSMGSQRIRHDWVIELNWISTGCWRRLLRVPWTTRRSNQSILKEISPRYSLEGLMMKLKLQYFGHLMWRTESLE